MAIPPKNNVFSLTNQGAYTAWRDWRLDQPPTPAEIPITPNPLSTDTLNALVSHCETYGYALFRLDDALDDKPAAITRLGQALGLQTIDSNLCAEDSGLTEIRVKDTHTDNAYIPYTSKPLGWHTDGYYNMPEQQIRAWLLFCAQPAMDGGINGLLDHQVAYIRLRDENPEWIRALSAPTAFTIPPNFEGGKQIRAASTGPVFSVRDEALHMRYSARQRNVIWAEDTPTQEAAGFLLELLNSNDPHIAHLQLQAGQGVISNNVLHNRSGFRDSAMPGEQRLIYRARYYDRISAPA